MAAPRDRVGLLKRESVATGGNPGDEGDFEPDCPLDPHNDAPMVAGIFPQSPNPADGLDGDVFVARDADGNLCLRDRNADGGNVLTLSQLLAGMAFSIDDVLIDDVTGLVLVDDVLGTILTDE